MDNILKFFPSSQGDGLNIIWAHGVSSHQELDEKLNVSLPVMLLEASIVAPVHAQVVKSSRLQWEPSEVPLPVVQKGSVVLLMDEEEDGTMMIETDIILRGMGTPEQTEIPVSAHPPATDSDLMTRDFIHKTTMTPGKGMKLDIKHLKALKPTMEILSGLEERVNCPLWMNADVVKGPNSPRDPLDPVEFIRTANNYVDGAVMSLGFTTAWEPGRTEDMYTWTMIFDILQYTYPLDPQLVTFPIRAMWCVRSWPKLIWLLGLRETFSVTVWSSLKDPVNVQGLISLRTHGDIGRIFYDLPSPLRGGFLGAIEAGDPEPDRIPHSDFVKSDWEGYQKGQGNFVFLSRAGAAISGPAHRAGYMQSVREHRAVAGESVVVVRGRVQFVDRYHNPSNDAILEVIPGTQAINSTDPAIFSEGFELPSPKLRIGRGGLMELGRKFRQLPPAECYEFELIDSIIGLEAWVTVATSSDAAVLDPNDGRECNLSITCGMLPEVGEQSLVLITKRGGTGDLIIENLTVVEAKAEDSPRDAEGISNVDPEITITQNAGMYNQTINTH